MFLISTLLDQPLLLPYGLACLAAQLLLYAVFRFALPPGPWTKCPSYTAHQIVAFTLMVHWTILGVVHMNDDTKDEVDSSIPLSLRPIKGGMEMAQRSTGALWLWDIPISLFFNDASKGSGSDLVMHMHHFAMLLVSCVVLGIFSIDGAPVCSNLAPIFFGVIEASSIPLQVVDFFHPKKSPFWHEYQSNSAVLSQINEVSRILFALTFLVVRGLFFPYAVVARAMPETWGEISAGSEYSVPLGIILTLSVPFSILQFYWATLVAKQVKRSLFPGGGSEKKKE